MAEKGSVMPKGNIVVERVNDKFLRMTFNGEVMCAQVILGNADAKRLVSLINDKLRPATRLHA